MSSGKMRVTIYLTPENKRRLKDRADSLAMAMGDYVAELIICDTRLKILESIRNGVRIPNGKWQSD